VSESTLRTGLSPKQWCETYGYGNGETVRQLLTIYEEMRGVSLRVGSSTSRLISPEVSGLLTRAYEEAQGQPVAPVFRKLLAVTQEPRDELAVAARTGVALFEGKLLEFTADLAERLTQATDQRFEVAEAEWRRRAERRMEAIDQFQGQLLLEAEERFATGLTTLLHEEERDLAQLRQQRQQDLAQLTQATTQLAEIRQASRQTQETAESFRQSLGDLHRQGSQLDQVVQAAQADRVLSRQLVQQAEALTKQGQAQRLRLPAWVGFGIALGFTACLLLLLLAPGLLNSRLERQTGLVAVWVFAFAVWGWTMFRP
jgi:hypothetical protein